MTIIKCSECSAEISDSAKTCPKCGATTAYESTRKKALVALLLCWFLGVFGVHRFYAGYKSSAFIMLILGITMIGMIVTGIWALVDLIMIACGKFRDGNDEIIKW